MKFTEVPLKHYNYRPVESVIDTIVVHSIFAPERPQCFDPKECIWLLDQNNVSAHYLISQDAEIFLLVDERERAWHAGVSQMPSPDLRQDVNNFSLGIELIGDRDKGFAAVQYQALAELTADIQTRHPIKAIVGHDQIAPDRKIDPGPLFDWNKYRQQLSMLQADKAQTSFKIFGP